MFKVLGKTISVISLIIGIVGLVVVVCIFIIVKDFLDNTNVKEAIRGSNTTSIYSSPVVLREIHELGQLTTASHTLNNPNVSITIWNGLLDVCGITARHVALGEIKAGIDLNHITEEHILFNESSNEYTMVLPQPSLMSCNITSINQYNTSGRSIFCDTNLDMLRQLAEYQALIEFRDGAVQENILDTARLEAHRQLSQLIRTTSGDQTMKIVFDEGVSVTDDLTCRPSPPEGWVYDENNSRWKKE